MEDLRFALLDTSAAIASREVAVRARSLTLDGTRFKRPGPIAEGTSLDGLLRAARAACGSRCLVQSYGHVLAEEWRPEGDRERGALEVLTEWFPASGAMAAGRHRPDGAPEGGCWLVDLERWEDASRPALDAAGNGLLADFPPAFYRSAIHLRPEDPAARQALAPFLGAGIARFEPGPGTRELGPAVEGYLAGQRRLLANLPRGVFVWNIEPYTDVESPPEDFAGPLAALYSVAAGFKPNRLLETHGFDASTRVVFFDYSQPGLAFRRLLCKDWDGRDYPRFLARLFRRLPASEAHYCLWEGQTPESLDWDAVARRWRQEVDAWGGAGTLARHWAHYRRLDHRFVEVDLLGDRSALSTALAAARDETAAIWWSNAFFSLVSNWFHPAGARRQIYRSFLAELAGAAPGLWLYGASSDNVAVNHVQAAAYQRWFAAHGGDELDPGRLHHCELLF